MLSVFANDCCLSCSWWGTKGMSSDLELVCTRRTTLINWQDMFVHQAWSKYNCSNIRLRILEQHDFFGFLFNSPPKTSSEKFQMTSRNRLAIFETFPSCSSITSEAQTGEPQRREWHFCTFPPSGWWSDSCVEASPWGPRSATPEVPPNKADTDRRLGMPFFLANQLQNNVHFRKKNLNKNWHMKWSICIKKTTYRFSHGDHKCHIPWVTPNLKFPKVIEIVIDLNMAWTILKPLRNRSLSQRRFGPIWVSKLPFFAHLLSSWDLKLAREKNQAVGVSKIMCLSKRDLSKNVM